MGGLSYGGFKDAFVKFETKATELDKFTAECLYGIGSSVLGVKFNGTSPSAGANFASGPYFASVMSSEKFTQFNAHASFNATDQLTLATTCQYGGKKQKSSVEWGLAAAYKFDKTMTIK